VIRIVRTRRYLRDIKRLKASPDDVERMEQAIAASPLSSPAIQGLRGVRKGRFRIANRGKSGGGRAIYLFLVTENAVIMLMAYAKSEKDDLSADDRKTVLSILRELGA